MIQDKKFYKQFFAMWVVIALQLIVTISVNLADNIMLGGYSQTSLSGVASVNQVQFIYQQLLMALGDAVAIPGTQYFGQKRTKPIRSLSSIGLHYGLGLAILLFVLATAFPRTILLAFTTDEPIIEAGIQYLHLIRFTYIPFAITQILLASLRSVGIVRIALYLSMSTLVINTSINYVLIYGHFGAPEMGVAGAAIGTIIARICELVILLLFIHFREKTLNLKAEEYLHLNPTYQRDYFKIMWPLFMVNGLWGLNTALQTVILGHMTARAIAANSAASSLYLWVKSTGIAAATTGAYFIGKEVGRQKEKKEPASNVASDSALTSAKKKKKGRSAVGELGKLARTLQVLNICIGLVGGITLFFLRIPVLSMYKLDPETMIMANKFLIILSVVECTMTYQMATNNGIVKGGGDTAYVLKQDLICIWMIVIPLSFFLAFYVKASPVWVVLCLNSDQIFKCIPAFIKANFGHWAKNLTN